MKILLSRLMVLTGPKKPLQRRSLALVPVAQLVEHPTFNRTVEGSNPSGHTIPPSFHSLSDLAPFRSAFLLWRAVFLCG